MLLQIRDSVLIRVCLIQWEFWWTCKCHREGIPPCKNRVKEEFALGHLKAEQDGSWRCITWQDASHQGILTRRELSGFLAITEFTGMLVFGELFFFNIRQPTSYNVLRKKYLPYPSFSILSYSQWKGFRALNRFWFKIKTTRCRVIQFIRGWNFGITSITHCG